MTRKCLSPLMGTAKSEVVIDNPTPRSTHCLKSRVVFRVCVQSVLLFCLFGKYTFSPWIWQISPQLGFRDLRA